MKDNIDNNKFIEKFENSVSLALGDVLFVCKLNSGDISFIGCYDHSDGFYDNSEDIVTKEQATQALTCIIEWINEDK